MMRTAEIKNNINHKFRELSQEEFDAKYTRVADKFRARRPGAGQMFIFVGKSERGKTHFMRWLIHDQMKFKHMPVKVGLVFVQTRFNRTFDFVPPDRVIQGYKQEVLQQYVQNVERLIAINGYAPPSFIVFDDLVGILNNETQWFINFIGTYRHYNITIYIAVQYLSGRHAISPIMREQTTAAILFNSKTTRTVTNLYESFGQLFESRAAFQEYFFNVTEPSKVGPYVAMVYFEREDVKEKNYVPMRAPAKIKTARDGGGDDDDDDDDGGDGGAGDTFFHKEQGFTEKLKSAAPKAQYFWQLLK
jgi:hypothetical protein